ncbi:hypothetical protein HBH98_084360 [Parastagonospora nodorum]|nr:hypothetical protein HBH53_064160 [Parastagonospora nodorum]KAH3974131.1 hypothetical protein HBH51_094080 [Parastagonospora nodorum]KAH4347707.1 hypothetical protein HBH98_084360 [Parastagonospora nodorum]KAH4360690.1 hypothetical protein HBH97_203800 [Parastagonospora nodorum]KAH4407769.1 hypothetical protein HBH99_077590 [Parastagonospora nodorum]
MQSTTGTAGKALNGIHNYLSRYTKKVEPGREARAEIKHCLIRYMKNPHSLDKAYVTYKDVSRAWSGRDAIQDVLHKTALLPWDIDKINRRLLRFLSILVYLDAHDFLDGPRSNFFHDDGELIYNDAYLPAHDDEILPIESFTIRKQFLKEQYLFLPEIIEESSRIRIIGDERRLPFDHLYGVSEITYGAYGTVDGVGISPGYFTTSDNHEVELVAYKRFHAADPHAVSARVLKDIRILKESIKSHVSIRIHLATLLHRGEHLVLLPWMDNLDLEHLLVGGYDFNIRDVDGFATPLSTAAKDALVHDVCVQLYHIADALAWLHEGIVRPGRKGRMYFVHMDLRPNIIFVDRETSSGASMVGTWALTDFGISAFRDDDSSTPSEIIPTVRDAYERSTVQMTPRRGTSTYQPPEAQRANRRRSNNTAGSNERHAGREADIWSFACIFSEALTFALGHASAVREFRAYRTRRHEHDYFYEAVDPKGSQKNDGDYTYNVRNEVSQWLQQLDDDCNFPSRAIDCCVLAILQTLAIDISDRPKAKELVSMMDHVRHHTRNADTLVVPEGCPLNKLYPKSERSIPASPTQTNEGASAMRQDSHIRGLVMPHSELLREEGALKSHDSPKSTSLARLEQDQYRSGMDSEAREKQGLSFKRREPSTHGSALEITRGGSASLFTNDEDIESDGANFDLRMKPWYSVSGHTVSSENMRITSNDESSFFNGFKAFVEDNTLLEWDWWPLRPRMLELPTGKKRLEWHVAGRTYFEELTPVESVAMQEMMNRTQDHPPKCCCCAAMPAQYDLSGFIKTVWNLLCSTGFTWSDSIDLIAITIHVVSLWIGVHLPRSRQPVASKAQQLYTPPLPTASAAGTGTSSNLAQNMLPQAPSHLGSSGTTMQMQTGVLNQAFGISLPTPLWVIFGVSSGSVFFEIENIEMSNALMNDAAFFQELRRLENKYRRPVLRWFSPFTFAYCNFVQFETMNTDRIFCCGESLPEDHGHEAHYEYHPRPPGVKNPPIRKNEFRTYLHACESFCLLYYLPLLKHKCATPHRDSHKWKRIPRKKAEYDTKTGTPGDYAFGLEAVYVLSFPTVFAYHTLSILGWSGFWIWWLKQHPNDLQNASVPTMVFMGIIASFWVLPGRGNRV